MNKIALSFGVLLLLAIAFFYFSAPPFGESVKTLSIEEPEPTKKPPLEQDKALQLERTVTDLETRTENAISKSAELVSPEEEKKLVDRLMSRRDPKYRILFSSWRLDASTSESILRIIRDRELEQGLLMYDMLHAKPESRNLLMNERRAAKELATFNLVSILGERRMRELTAAEKEVRSEMKNHLRELVGD